MIRAGKLEYNPQYNVRKELEARRGATKNLGALLSWIREYVPGAQSVCGPLLDTLGARRSVSKEAASFFDDIVGSYHLVVRESEIKGDSVADETRLRFCSLLLETAARQGLVDGPAVLVTTTRAVYEKIADDYRTWLRSWCAGRNYDPPTMEVLETVTLEHLRQWLIVRRLEVHYLPTATLSAIIRLCVESAQSLLFRDERDRDGEQIKGQIKSGLRHEISWNIRLVMPPAVPDHRGDEYQPQSELVRRAVFQDQITFRCSRKQPVME